MPGKTTGNTAGAAPRAGGAEGPLLPPHDRVRFVDFSFTTTPAGYCAATSRIEYEGRLYAGGATGASSPVGDLRTSAAATVAALGEFVGDPQRFELVGVKPVRAFDWNVVIVSVVDHAGGRGARLVGCCIADDDVRRAAALAILNATNRVLGASVARR